MAVSVKFPRVDHAAQFRAHADEIRAAVDRVLVSGRYVLGPEVAAFEAEFATYLGASEVVAVADGTRAISLALRALGVGPGSEVVTTPFTAIPTIGAIAETGARPVFVDINPSTWLLDLDAASAAVSERTGAILPVHMFGNVVDIPELDRRLPRRVPIVEDAAQAHGSRLGSRFAGTMGAFGTFSFYPTKNLGGYGDGGAIIAGDWAAAETFRLWRNHGMKDKDVCAATGVNSRLDEIQAAVLRVKLRHLDAMNAARAARVAAYLERLPEEFFTPQRATDDAVVNNHLLQLRYLGNRDALVAALEVEGIQTNVYYVVPHHLQPAFTLLGYREGSFPILEALCRQAIALPLYPEMPFEVIDVVTTIIRRHIKGTNARPNRR